MVGFFRCGQAVGGTGGRAGRRVGPAFDHLAVGHRHLDQSFLDQAQAGDFVLDHGETMHALPARHPLQRTGLAHDLCLQRALDRVGTDYGH